MCITHSIEIGTDSKDVLLDPTRRMLRMQVMLLEFDLEAVPLFERKANCTKIH